MLASVDGVGVDRLRQRRRQKHCDGKRVLKDGGKRVLKEAVCCMLSECALHSCHFGMF